LRAAGIGETKHPGEKEKSFLVGDKVTPKTKKRERERQHLCLGGGQRKKVAEDTKEKQKGRLQERKKKDRQKVRGPAPLGLIHLEKKKVVRKKGGKKKLTVELPKGPPQNDCE